MVAYTLEHREEILRHYFENYCRMLQNVCANCVRILEEEKHRHIDLTVLRYLVKKAKETTILIDKPKRERPNTVCTPENIAAVAERVREVPSTFTLILVGTYPPCKQAKLLHLGHRKSTHIVNFGPEA